MLAQYFGLDETDEEFDRLEAQLLALARRRVDEHFLRSRPTVVMDDEDDPEARPASPTGPPQLWPDPLRHLDAPPQAGPTQVCVSPSGSWLAWTMQGVLQLMEWSVGVGELRVRWEAACGEVAAYQHRIAFSQPDERLVAVVSMSGALVVDVRTGEHVQSLAWSVLGAPPKVVLQDAPVARLGVLGPQVFDVYALDGELDEAVLSVPVPLGAAVPRFVGEDAFFFVPAEGHADLRPGLRRIDDGEYVASPEVHVHTPASLSPSGEWLACWGEEGVVVLDTHTAQVVATVPLPGSGADQRLFCVSDPRHNSVVHVERDAEREMSIVSVYKAQTLPEPHLQRQRCTSLVIPEEVSRVVHSTRATFVTLGWQPGLVRVWDSLRCHALAQFVVGQSAVLCVSRSGLEMALIPEGRKPILLQLESRGDPLGAFVTAHARAPSSPDTARPIERSFFFAPLYDANVMSLIALFLPRVRPVASQS